MPDVTVTSDIDTFLKSSNNSTARTNLGAESAPTSIANKEAAYALSGVAAGTVYKTEDTGQVLEKVGHVPAIQQTFNISDAGSPTGWIGANDLVAMKYVWDDASGKFLGEDDSYIAEVVYDTDRWHQKSMLSTNFTSPVCDESTHPADVVGAWTKVHASAAGTIADGAVTMDEPRNWKHDGTILVTDNDEKQLLTNLPDGQQVEIVGEGGRIERFNGDGDGLNEGDFKILVNHPDNPVISGMRINGIYSYDPSNYFYLNDDGVILGNYGDGTYVFHTSSVQWSAPINGNATPDLMSPWTAQSTEAQGYAAMTSDMITRQPTATESNWFTIKNTVELTWHDDWYSGDQTINGITAPEGTATNVGWVAVGERIQGTDTSTDNYTWTTTQINGLNPNIQTFPKMVLLDNAGILIPDAFPSGATITVKSS